MFNVFILNIICDSVILIWIYRLLFDCALYHFITANTVRICWSPVNDLSQQMIGLKTVCPWLKQQNKYTIKTFQTTIWFCICPTLLHGLRYSMHFACCIASALPLFFSLTLTLSHPPCLSEIPINSRLYPIFF